MREMRTHGKFTAPREQPRAPSQGISFPHRYHRLLVAGEIQSREEIKGTKRSENQHL